MTRSTPAPRTLRAFTDYPIAGSAGVVEIEVLAYDRDKYANVRLLSDPNATESVKSGYIFLDAALTQRPGMVRLYGLPTEMGEPGYNRRQVHATLKTEHKRKTEYNLWVGETRHTYATLREALRHLARVYRTHDCGLCRTRKEGYSWVSMPLLDVETGLFDISMNRKGRAVFKVRHFKRYLVS